MFCQFQYTPLSATTSALTTDQCPCGAVENNKLTVFTCCLQHKDVLGQVQVQVQDVGMIR